MIDRIVRAIRLDWTVFSEIAQDRHAMNEAVIIVLIVSFLSAIGSGIADKSISSFVSTLIMAVAIGWILWAIITFFVGTRLLGGKTSIPEMMRVLGYANAPHLLGLFRFVPCIGPVLPWVGWLLALVAGVLAVREAMEFETDKALITVLVSWLISVAIRAVFQFVF